MNLDALLEPLPERNPKYLCKVGSIVESLQDPYKSALRDLLNNLYENGGLSDEAVADRMTAAGLKIGSRTVYRHRRKACTCPEQVWA